MRNGNILISLHKAKKRNYIIYFYQELECLVRENKRELYKILYKYYIQSNVIIEKNN